jgi:protein-S-isoprenylcysteine O-methyltransferase Ste14
MAGVGELSRARTLVVVPAAATDRAPGFWLRVKPPRLALALTAAAFALHALVLGGTVASAQSLALGVPIALAGFAWMVWAWAAFRRAGTALPPTARPTMLVDEGPFRFGRNPMYLGIAVAMVGVGVAAGVPLMAVAAANFVAIVATVHIPHEEAQMQHVFGGWYSDYAASVRRWL